MTTYELPARQGLTLLRLRLLGVPQPNALKHVGRFLRPMVSEPQRKPYRDTAGLTGRKFGRLTVEERGLNILYWRCRCECGNTKLILRHSLATGHTRSCGCLRRETTAATKHKHGHSPRFGPWTPEYTSWANMLRLRRNITDRRWYRFENFLADMGPKPPGTKLTCLRRHRGYRPGNVVWR